MTEAFDDAGVLAPVSAEAPCGPDLDAEGDAEFMNFMAATEGQLPAAYFTTVDGKPKAFDRKSIDFNAAFAAGEKLLTRTHDVRPLVLLAKLAILNRDLDRFAHWCAVLARLLADRWDDVHPRGEDGDFVARISQLSTLDDGPVVILPLQYAPLAETQRDGALVFRAQLVALGDLKPREGENLPNAGAIDKILLNADMSALTNTLRALQRIKSSIAQIRTISIERAGFEQGLNFEALSPLVEKMTSFIQGAVARRDPTVAAPETSEEAAPAAEAGAPGPAPEFASLADVDAALGSALGYFESKEPSSAAVLLIGQARQVLGKNLYDVMKLLAPAHADHARIFVGAEPVFTVPVSSISANGAQAETWEPRETPPAASRAAALALIESVAAHLRKAEPSSPAPYLLDRAKALASRDFLSLLKDLLSEDALSQMKGGGW
jgi:type VI secretion system protein ImpA